MNLNQLEKLAKAAAPSERTITNIVTKWSYGINPDTVLKLIAVARAAKDLCQSSIEVYPEQYRTEISKALAALEEE